MAIDFSCSGCGQAYRVAEAFAGKSTKCKKCGTAIVVPKPPEPEPELSDMSSLLDEDGYQPQRPLKPVAAADGPKCPACQATLKAGAVVCVNCGYDLLNRRSLAPKQAKKKKKKASLLSGEFGGLLRGTALSAVGAVLGAIMWAVVAVLIHREIGWIAWGVGAAAGGGMSIGYDDKGDGTVPGLIAAVMSLCGILLGKVLIVVWLILPLLNQEEPEELPFARLTVADKMAQDALAAKGLTKETATPAQLSDEHNAAMGKLANLSPEEIDEKFLEIVKANAGKAELKIGPDDLKMLDEPAGQQAAAEPAQGLIGAFFSAMFGPMDAIFILLAFFTAYKIGSGGTSD